MNILKENIFEQNVFVTETIVMFDAHLFYRFPSKQTRLSLIKTLSNERIKFRVFCGGLSLAVLC